MNCEHITIDPKAQIALADFQAGLFALLGYNLVKIILYGSYARNEQDHESDLDVMVLVQSEEEITKECTEEIKELTFQMLVKHELLISPIIKKEKKFQEYTGYVPFYANVLMEGIAIDYDDFYLTSRKEADTQLNAV